MTPHLNLEWNRFAIGGVVVSSFALLSDLLKPKSFAGLFGAARRNKVVRICRAIFVRRPDHCNRRYYREGIWAGNWWTLFGIPSIFPASATLIEKHEKQKKEIRRAAEVVSVDAKGTAIGSIGLAVFAVLVWRAIPHHPAWVVLAGATLAWVTVSVLFVGTPQAIVSGKNQ